MKNRRSLIKRQGARLATLQPAQYPKTLVPEVYWLETRADRDVTNLDSDLKHDVIRARVARKKPVLLK